MRHICQLADVPKNPMHFRFLQQCTFAHSSNHMKPLPHRLHRTLYPVPLLLFVLDAALSLYENRTGTHLSFRYSVFSWAVATGWLSFITGAISLFQLRKNTMASGAYFIHGFITGTALFVLSAFWTHETKTGADLSMASLPEVLIKAGLVMMLAAGALVAKWTGNRLKR